MEQILSNLLVPDNEIIKKATVDLKIALKYDAAVAEVKSLNNHLYLRQIFA